MMRIPLLEDSRWSNQQILAFPPQQPNLHVHNVMSYRARFTYHVLLNVLRTAFHTPRVFMFSVPYSQ